MVKVLGRINKKLNQNAIEARHFSGLRRVRGWVRQMSQCGRPTSTKEEKMIQILDVCRCVSKGSVFEQFSCGRHKDLAPEIKHWGYHNFKSLAWCKTFLYII